MTHEDGKVILKINVWNSWKEKWTNTDIKSLRKIKENVMKFEMPNNIKREEACKITRLRLGCTKLTHEHLLQKKDQPNCQHCNEKLTVEHILINCNKYHQTRIKYKINNMNILNEPHHLLNIIKFLKDINLFDEI